ncbi:hypothetical protein CEF21_09435 [Bacillus sp. FJAT-42376]|uniref:hypothetical protein n=1 Tax=Bacillus sp. FJAT-42376 TaxID=2014076 RepID=UPI000F5162D4|nr:hypothetical protein [Bacillus sp. FJAT-42376]AZB42490.1 hypothetical protein CEF21_09435 [Bacillus sp. FJAT-42376]
MRQAAVIKAIQKECPADAEIADAIKFVPATAPAFAQMYAEDYFHSASTSALMTVFLVRKTENPICPLNSRTATAFFMSRRGFLMMKGEADPDAAAGWNSKERYCALLQANRPPGNFLRRLKAVRC